MKTLNLLLMMLLLTGSVVAQDSTSTSGAPDVSVVKIDWRRVDGMNPMLVESRHGYNPEAGQRRAVNASRAHQSRSDRESGGNAPPPKLLSVPSTPEPTPTLIAWAGYSYEFTVKNTGTKTIRHVVFEHSFIDPSTQRTVRRRQYKSKVRIEPGTTAKIVARTSLPPFGVINARQTGQTSLDPSSEQMVIQKIKYADGSVWQRETK